MHIRKIGAGALGVCGLAMVAAACGTAQPTSPTALLKSGIHQLQSTSSYHFSMFEKVAGPGGAIPPNDTVQFTGEVSTGQPNFSEQIAFPGRTSMTLQEIVAPRSDVAFYKFPLAALQGVSNVPWLEVSLGAVSTDVTHTTALTADTAKLLSTMTHPVLSGSATVNGQQTTVVRGEVQLSAFEQVYGSEPFNNVNLVPVNAPSAKVVLDAYITASGQVERVSASLANAGKTSMEFRLDFTDPNAPVSISAPPASETTFVKNTNEFVGVMFQFASLAQQV